MSKQSLGLRNGDKKDTLVDKKKDKDMKYSL